MPEPFPSPAVVRAAIGRTARRARHLQDPQIAVQLEDLHRDHAVAKLADYITRTVDAAPPLTDEQRERLAALLRPAAGDAA